MVDLYVELIIAKRRTIDTIYQRYRTEVLAELNRRGYDGNGDPL